MSQWTLPAFRKEAEYKEEIEWLSLSVKKFVRVPDPEYQYLEQYLPPAPNLMKLL